MKARLQNWTVEEVGGQVSLEQWKQAHTEPPPCALEWLFVLLATPVWLLCKPHQTLHPLQPNPMHCSLPRDFHEHNADDAALSHVPLPPAPRACPPSLKLEESQSGTTHILSQYAINGHHNQCFIIDLYLELSDRFEVKSIWLCILDTPRCTHCKNGSSSNEDLFDTFRQWNELGLEVYSENFNLGDDQFLLL